MNHPGVRFPPPALFVAGVALSAAVERWGLPLRLSAAASGAEALFVVGWALVVLGSAVSAWALVTFAAAGTAVMPNRPAVGVVTHGPYRFSRNPMYVSLVAVYTGIALIYDTGWPLVFGVPIVAVIDRYVIAREEAYLALAYPSAYGAYRARVRRWL